MIDFTKVPGIDVGKKVQLHLRNGRSDVTGIIDFYSGPQDTENGLQELTLRTSDGALSAYDQQEVTSVTIIK